MAITALPTSERGIVVAMTWEVTFRVRPVTISNDEEEIEQAAIDEINRQHLRWQIDGVDPVYDVDILDATK